MDDQLPEHQNDLQYETLLNIWQNYLNATNQVDAKQHWLELFLFHFQFVDLKRLQHDETFNSFFNPIPEEICSFLLEQVYEIISKSELYSPTKQNLVNDVETAATQHETVAQLLRQNHNFAQLILSAPTDCSKIVALRNFLTHQLGQHLLQFLLQVDIKYIASQKSLCNLCINLFPDCPWGTEQYDGLASLPAPTTIFEYVGTLNLHHKPKTKATNSATITTRNSRIEMQQKHWNDDFNASFAEFREAHRTSDEIAFLLIALLSKCTAAETTLVDQSMSTTSLNFALDALQMSTEAFGTPQNAQVIKCRLLHLIEQCTNNLLACKQRINVLHFRHVLTKLAHVSASNNATSSVGTACDYESIAFALNYIIFGILYNIVVIYCNAADNSNNIAYDFFDENVIDVCIASLQQMLLHEVQLNAEQHFLLTNICKILLKIVDNLSKCEQQATQNASGNSSSMTNSLHQQQRPQRRRKYKPRQMHCQSSAAAASATTTPTPTLAKTTLSCYFQGTLLRLLPNLGLELQTYVMRHLLGTGGGTCCCHYNLDNYAMYLQIIQRLEGNAQKCAYKLLQHKVLCTIFQRNLLQGQQQRLQPANCAQCNAKMKSLEFHAGLLQHYRQLYTQLTATGESDAFNVFLKHLKHIAHLLTNDIAAGVLAEIVLPIFRAYKTQFLTRALTLSSTSETRKSFWSRAQEKTEAGVAAGDNSTASVAGLGTPTRPPLQIHIKATDTIREDTLFLKTLTECLNIFVIYLSDIHLIKAFYNEENIKHLEDLLAVPELMRGICDLIKVGIDNVTFLGDNSQEQMTLSRRLIALQLQSSDSAVQRFNRLLCRLIESTPPDAPHQTLFWLDEQQKQPVKTTDDLRPLDILHIAASQWSLNNELLKTSQCFYNEFAKLYSIEVDADTSRVDCTADESKTEHKAGLTEAGGLGEEIVAGDNLLQSDKTIIDILKLNYNALSCFLLRPPQQCTTNVPHFETNEDLSGEGLHSLPQTPQSAEHIYTFESACNSLGDSSNAADSSSNKASDCYSSSLETLLSSISVDDCIAAHMPSAISATTIAVASSTFIDSATLCAVQTHDTECYVEAINETFLQKLQQLEKQQQKDSNRQLTDSIVLFDIRNQTKDLNAGFKASASPLTSSVISSTVTSGALASVLADPKTHHVAGQNNDGIIGKLFSMFGSFFVNSRSNSLIDFLSARHNKQGEQPTVKAVEIDLDLQCLFTPCNESKKLLLKLFEATMAICIKGYQNEEVEKMQKHLQKLKAIILSNATANWQQPPHTHKPNHHTVEHHNNTEDNSIIQTLQTLLKIAELSNTLNEPAAVVSSSILTTATDEPTPLSLPSRVPSFNSGARTHQPHLFAAGKECTSFTLGQSPTTPGRPQSGESECDYFSTRASLICADSEIELSENEKDDFYLTADEGYEADGEIPEVTDSEADIATADLWASFQPTSRYRTHVLHEGLCRLVVEILIELAQLCVRNPLGWSECLAQLANRLFVIRDHLGGPLFLLRGFSPVLQCNDLRLKELQQSILELIVDLNTPDVLCVFLSILASKNPPVDILMKYMSYICASSLKKAQPSVELEFPIAIDGKCVSTSDSVITEHIDRIRNYHLYSQVTTPFTRAACIIPITHARLWNNDGFTLSLWLQVKSTQMHKSSSQLIDDDARSSGDDYLKSHIVSIGSNQAMLSIYINSNMNLVFETSKPNAEMQARAPTSPNGDNSDAVPANVQETKASPKTLTNGQTTTAQSPTASTQLRQALKQTKLVLLHSFNNLPLFNGHADGDTYIQGTALDLKHFRMARNKWTHLTVAIAAQPDRLDLNIYIDGLEKHFVRLPFRHLRHLTRTHTFQLVAVGDGVTPKATNNAPVYNTESRSSFDGYPLRTSISNLMLFNRNITVQDAILNLTAMGPDFTELTQCQVGNTKPNYGYLNLCKLKNANFGNYVESMRLLKETRILTYTAQQPDVVMNYEPTIELDNVAFGRPCGLIIYGELLQNQLRSLQTATILCGGLSALLYMFARVVESSHSAVTQATALDLLLNVALSESQLYAEFWRNEYISLIGFVIKTERCTKDVQLFTSIMNNACSQQLISKKGNVLLVNDNTIASVVYPRLIVSVLHRYSDWHRSGAEHSDVLDMLFQCILALTREKHPHRDFNMDQLNKAGLIKEMFNLCKVYVIESPNPVCISKIAAEAFVNILATFAGSPPSPSLMDEIMKLLLLLHKPSECYITHDRSKFYFLLSTQTPAKEKSLSGTAANLGRVTAPFRRNFGSERSPGTAVPVQKDDLSAERAARIARLRKLHARNSPYKRAVNEFEENLGAVADCARLNKNALRLVSPQEASNWHAKFRRRFSFNFSANKSPQKNARKSPTKTPVAFAPHQKIARKRLRLNSATSQRAVLFGDGRRTQCNSESSARSFAVSSFDFDWSNAATLNDVFSSTPIQRRSKSALVKTDFYNSLGIIALQESLFKLLKDFLCLLPDNAVEEVLKHYVKLEFLLVLANHSSCAVRAAIIKLLAALTLRLSPSEVVVCNKNFYAQHLANQLTIYPTDAQMFEACMEWIIGMHAELEALLGNETNLRIQQRFGLCALLAIPTKTIANSIELASKEFNVLHKIYTANSEDQQALIEAGLLQCFVKALHNAYAKQNLLNTKTEESILQLLTTVGEKSLKSAGQINIIWDILNMLTFHQQKQPNFVIKGFRSLQSQLQLNWFNMFFANSKEDSPNFKVHILPESSLSLAETKTRLDLLFDRCSQFFTIFDANYTPSDNEIKLFELLVSYGIATNQRCNNFIAWGLQPSRPRDLRAFIVDALWQSCQDDFVPSIICDGKMIKSLLWLCLIEDLDEPIVNLEPLCKRLAINEQDSVWNLEAELGRIELNRSTMSAKQKSLLDKTIHKFESLAVGCIESSMVTTRRVVELQNAERKLIMSQMKDYDETYTYTKWLEIIRRMTHEGAPWYCKERCESSWELDDTEGPSRVHTRLRRCHLEIDKRFMMEDYQDEANKDADSSSTNNVSLAAFTRNDDYTRPLDFLISSYDQQLNISLNAQILYNFPAKYLPVDGEIDGEIIVTDHRLYFIATYHCKYFYVSCDVSNITEIWLKRYQHQEKAFEIFLDTNQSLFFSLQNRDDWRIMRDVFCDKIVSQPDNSKVLLITQQWREGLLTNWEYLMSLNQISGRTYNDLMQYPVFPWILSNYTTDVLDLMDAQNFRKLEKPIAVQLEQNEEHYINNYTYINNTSTNMGSMTLKPYHYSSHYSNSGTVLHFLVRVPPFTSYFLRYQDNNFDLPDRTFHALSTTWKLASRDSPTDVKELIPEFFCLPEMFENFERFNFGCRQNGERVENVLLPPWCLRDPRLFVLIHRQALECELVRNGLHQWIDLIFGFKQTGQHAVDAINVFHPATYAVFLESEIKDPIERKAVETMVKTYGQMPRQLFRSPHGASKALQYAHSDKPILQQVRGLRWGVYVGSPQLTKPMLGNIHKLPGADKLLSLSNTNVVYGLPAKSCVMQGAEVDTYNVVTWGYDDRIVRLQPLNKTNAKSKNLLHNSVFDDITACGASPNSNQLWFGHKSGRLSVYKCCSVEATSRTTKSRQSYVRGLRLSYNSAVRKMTAKTTGGIVSGMKPDADTDGETLPTLHTGSTMNANDATHHDSGAELFWNGPTMLVRHTDAITCISLSVEFKIAVSAGRDGIAVIWDLNDWRYVRTIARPAEIHHSPITLLALSPTLGDIVSVHTILRRSDDGNDETSHTATLATAADECFEVTEESLDDFVNVSINPNGKSILRLHTVNARYVQHFVHDEQILAVCYSYIKEGVGVNVIATAVEGGIVRLWSSWNLSFVSEIVTGISNIKSITYSVHQHLVVLTKESHIQVWEADGLYGSSPKFPQIAYK